MGFERTQIPGLSTIPRVPLAYLPTPLVAASRLSAAIGGPKLWIKRDDMTGIGFGGNKIRGMEFLLADALAQGADTLVTGAAPQSNSVRATAAVAAYAGLAMIAVYSGSPLDKVEGNYHLTCLAGAEVRFTNDPDRASVDGAIEAIANELRAAGRKPYTIPRGGANVLGTLGYVLAVHELAEQCAAHGVVPDAIVLATGSCGTHAGVVAGIHALHLPWRVEGFTVSRPVEEAQTRVLMLAQAALDRLGMKQTLKEEAVIVHGGFIGPGYGIPTAEGAEAIRIAARSEGLFLDPTYTGKALAGYIASCRSGYFRPDETIIFLHTGGEPALFVSQSPQAFQSPQAGQDNTRSATAPLEHKDTPAIRKGQVGMHWGEAAFNPRSIALIGASARPGKMGQLLMRNLLEGYPGKLFPINPAETEILGQRAYPRVQDVAEPVDLAVIALPPELCVEAMRDCAKAGTRTALVLSGGFAETGPEGQQRQDALLEAARAGGVRLIGPNCFGLYNCNLGLNASMGLGLPPKGGNISLVTQSGAYGMAIFILAQARHLRFAKILSHGNKADLTDHEILEYFADDDETRVLCLFLESVSNGRAFYEALVYATQRKPVVIAKTGRSTAGRRAAASHTAALTGDMTAFITAVRQAGAILAESGLEMVDIAEGLSRQPLPPGRRVGIITNSGGTGVELTDMCERFGLSVPELPAASQERISSLLPVYASPRNPVDVTPAWAKFPTMYGGSIEALYACDEIDIIIPLLLHRSALMRENAEAVRDAIWRCQRERGIAKPTYICWVAGSEGAENQALLQESGVAVYEWPERVARTAAAIAAYAATRRTSVAQQEVPLPPPPEAYTKAESIIAAARAQGRALLLEHEVKALLNNYGARVPRESLCTTSAEARAATKMLAGPCVLKIVSPDISHKSDVGGVRVGVPPAEVEAVLEEMLAAVRSRQPTAHLLGISVQELVHGQEVIIGGLRDSEFGPMLMFGLGGVFVEVLRDVAYRLLPATSGELCAMIREVRGYPLLTGVRGSAAADLESLTNTLQAAAWLLDAFPEIIELDLNPVFAGPEGAVVADGRAVLADETEQKGKHRGL